MAGNGLRVIDGTNVVAMDGLWDALNGIPVEDKMSAALEYAGCEFHDANHRLVAGHVISLVGIGGVPVARVSETDDDVRTRLADTVAGTQEMMGGAAAFSYLNSGEKSISDLYGRVTDLGHLSVAHTIQANMLVAGISEGAEVELSLQRDLVHLGKVTNARTKIQARPPIVVRDSSHIDAVTALYDHTVVATESLRKTGSPEENELVNGLFPVNKATLLMISGSLRNLGKLAALKDDRGKESELRNVAAGIQDQLGTLWPELFKTE